MLGNSNLKTTADAYLDSDLDSRIERRNLLLKDVDRAVIQKAWFTLSHLLLDEGSTVVDMGCNDGTMTYTMAVLNPKLKFIGVDKSRRQIAKAREKYQLHNLDFIMGDIAGEPIEPESVDAVINSDVLHEIYSGSRYNERIVSDTLRQHFSLLKKGGVMFIRDFARPPPEEYVLMEMPDTPSAGSDLARLSEADLLVWFAEHARPRHDAGTGGFFLEELPARFPRTRLFRLPHKWAYEFILRKDDRARWETELPMEYTFFTMREFRSELRALGARAQYAAPYWDDDIVEKQFEGKFRLYSNDGTPLGYPPTCYIVVAVKLGERKSLHIHERRPSLTEGSKLTITAMRDQKTGKLTDVVSPAIPASEVIPYRIDEEGQLKIYLCDGVARSIVNAVPRNGISLDERRWSGHMIEPLAVDESVFHEMGERNIKTSVLFARDYLGMRPRSESVLELGPDYYPDPAHIDERVYTYYLQVEPARGPITPRKFSANSDRFQTKGSLREFDAQQVLDAITVGMIPNARLELQILGLFQKLGIKAENWTGKHISLQAQKISMAKNLRTILNSYGHEKNRFKAIKGSAGELRPVHSIFVEEGQARGAITGLSSQDVDFIVHDQQTINTAVILPLKSGIKSDIHAGFTLDTTPVPQRYEGNAATISLPSFNLPPDVKDIRQAKKFVAEKFGVLPEMVIKMGESYFTHIGLTQQKIYPFAVTVPADFPAPPNTHFLPFYQLKLLRRSLGKSMHFMVMMARAYRYLHDSLRLDANMRVSAILKQRFAHNMPDWSAPLDYYRGPTLPPPEAKAESAPRTPLLNKPIPDYRAAKSMAPSLSSDFERELEAFIAEMEKDEELKPRPEKW